jgi:hypothetical protein
VLQASDATQTSNPEGQQAEQTQQQQPPPHIGVPVIDSACIADDVSEQQARDPRAAAAAAAGTNESYCKLTTVDACAYVTPLQWRPLLFRLRLLKESARTHRTR